MNLLAELLRRVAERPDQTAFVDGAGRRMTFAELDAATQRGAAQLRRLGLARGEVVFFMHPVSIPLYTGLLSVMRMGAVAMFVDPSASRAAMAAAVERVRPRAFFGSGGAQWLRLSVPAVRRIPVSICTAPWWPGRGRWPRGADAWSSVADCGDEDAALITFTSGSTGAPKAMARSHGLLRAQYEALSAALALVAGEVDLVTLPVFALANLAAGVTSVIADTDLARPGEVDAGAVLAQIGRERVTRVTASPALLARLAEGGLTGLDKIYTGGAPVFPPVLRALGTCARQATVVYGSSEAEPIAHIPLAAIEEQDWRRMREGGGLLVGEPVPEIEVAVLPNRWGESLLEMAPETFAAERQAAGEVGEIVVRGPHVLRGYLDGLGDKDTKIHIDGEVWHRTGDAGVFDGRGRLWLLGRAGAMIRDERGVLYPLAVETSLSFRGDIARSALVQLDDRRVLAVELKAARAAVDGDTIRNAVAWAQLDAVEILPSIPVDRRHNAKVDYPALRRRLASL